MAHIGEKIKQAREAAGLTQSELAEILDVEPPSVSRWESNTTSPRARQMPKLAKALGKPVEWFQETQDIDSLEAKLEKLSQELKNLKAEMSPEITKNEPLITEIIRRLGSLDENQLRFVLDIIVDLPRLGSLESVSFDTSRAVAPDVPKPNYNKKR